MKYILPLLLILAIACNKGVRPKKFIGSFEMCQRNVGSVTAAAESTIYFEECGELTVTENNDLYTVKFVWNNPDINEISLTGTYNRKDLPTSRHSIVTDTCSFCTPYENTQLWGRLYFKGVKLHTDFWLECGDTAVMSKFITSPSDTSILFDIHIKEK